MGDQINRILNGQKKAQVRSGEYRRLWLRKIKRSLLAHLFLGLDKKSKIDME